MWTMFYALKLYRYFLCIIRWLYLESLEKFKLMYLLYQNNSLFCFTFYDGSFAFSHFLTRKQLLWFYWYLVDLKYILQRKRLNFHHIRLNQLVGVTILFMCSGEQTAFPSDFCRRLYLCLIELFKAIYSIWCKISSLLPCEQLAYRVTREIHFTKFPWG